MRWCSRRHDYPQDELADSDQVHAYDPELDRLANTVDRTVTVSWGISVSGTGIENRLPARVIGVKTFDQGDTAVTTVNQTASTPSTWPRSPPRSTPT